MQGGKQRDRQRFDIRQASVFHRNGNDLVAVVRFRKRHRQRTTGIAQVLPASYPLRFMDMPERRINQPFIECIRRDGFQTAHNDALATVVVRQFGPGSMQMAHGDQCLTGLPPGIGEIIELAVHAVYTGYICIMPLLRSRIISLTQIRNGKTPAFPLFLLII